MKSGLSVLVVLLTCESRPRERQSRGTTRAHKLLVHVPAALCGCWGPELPVDGPAALWDAGTRDTGVRTSGVV